MLTVIYIVPAVSLVLLPFEKYFCFTPFHKLLGKYEWAIFRFRDFILSPVLIAYSVWARDFVWLVFVPFSISAYFVRRRSLRRLIQFIMRCGILSPESFSLIYFSSVSGIAGLPEKTNIKNFEVPADYGRGKKGISFLPIMSGTVFTVISAGLIMKAARIGDAEFTAGFGEKISAIWGASVMKCIGARFKISGVENAEGLRGRTIVMGNHKSFLDFVILPLTIGIINSGNGTKLHPRYIAARDHFKDNRFLYLLMGRAMEKAGVIFVDRKQKKESPKDAINLAEKKLASEEIDIVIFPQGTRAYPSFDRNKNRRDAGYYTTIRRQDIDKPIPHLRKGTAHLAWGARRLMHDGNILSLLSVAISGIGQIAPRGKFSIQRGENVTVKVGLPYDVPESASVDDIHVRIDTLLKENLSIHETLKKRLALDINWIFGEEGSDRFLGGVNAWSAEHDLIFSIIDCIYSTPVAMQKPYFQRFSHLLNECEEGAAGILEFRKNVVENMIGWK